MIPCKCPLHGVGQGIIRVLFDEQMKDPSISCLDYTEGGTQWRSWHHWPSRHPRRSSDQIDGPKGQSKNRKRKEPEKSKLSNRKIRNQQHHHCINHVNLLDFWSLPPTYPETWALKGGSDPLPLQVTKALACSHKLMPRFKVQEKVHKCVSYTGLYLNHHPQTNEIAEVVHQ